LDSFAPDPPKRQRRKPRGQFPEGLQPLERQRAKAVTLGLNCDQQFEQFRTWHLGKANVFADWHLAFDTWLSRAPEYQRSPAPARYGRPVEVSPNVDYETRKALRAVDEYRALVAGAK